ncbi:hypothetical protein HZC09_00600 [Candidatus Micrarchaeota archaeon]|nr:hypothetical protein [Candidatus Micrarchaeota archaeon]
MGKIPSSSHLQEALPFVLLGLLLAVAAFSLVQVYELKTALIQRTTVPTPVPLPALQITKLLSTSCAECWSPDAVAGELARQANATIETVSVQTTQGQELVRKNAISKVPTLIVTGQTGDSRLASFFAQGWRASADARIFVAQEPVYFNPLTYEVTGKVSIQYVVDPACGECADIGQLGKQLKNAGIYIDSEQTVNSTSQKGAELVKKYSPSSLPFAVLSKDIGAYTRVAESWKQVGSVEPDGFFVWRQAIPPYINTTTNSIVGFVSLVELEDKDCRECYNVSIHETILANLGVVVRNVSRVEISSPQGKAVASAYNITQVPTVLVSSDAQYYPSFLQIWSQVGSRETDGTFVFRNMQALPNATVANVTSQTKA